MTRCSICSLDPQKLDAVNAALRGNVPLEQISRGCGISKSTLHRHSQHLESAAASVLPAEVVAPVSLVRKPVDLPSTQPQTRADLIDRLELLWRESLEGLQAAKEPILLTKPDGSTLEVPGDLRSRAAFIREARAICEALGLKAESGARGPYPTVIRAILIPKIGESLAGLQLEMGQPPSMPALRDEDDDGEEI